MTLRVRNMTEAESGEIERIARSRTEAARLVERAKIVRLSVHGKTPPQIARAVKLSAISVCEWIKRFNAVGLDGLQDRPRSGAPRTYDEATVSMVVATALTDPQTLELPFHTWTLDRLAAYLHEARGVSIQRSRIGDLLLAEGLRWRKQETWFGERADPQFAEKRGSSRSSTPHRRRAA